MEVVIQIVILNIFFKRLYVYRNRNSEEYPNILRFQSIGRTDVSDVLPLLRSVSNLEFYVHTDNPM